jgi:radical SAM protein with 4Fe4S-binding SPASM domain
MGDDEIEQMRHARLSNVGVSVDGMEAHHNRIRGRGNAFEEVSRAFDLLARAGITSAAVTSLLEVNFSDLEPLYEFLLSKGVHIWQLQLVNPMGTMAGRHDLTLGAARLPGLIDFIYEKTSERRMIVVAADSIGYDHGESEGRIRGRREPICCWEGCQAGLTSVFIDSVGNVKGCGAMYDPAFVEGNIRQRPIGEIWRGHRLFSYNRAFEPSLLSGPCSDCDVGDVCKGGCRASNYFTTGRLYENGFCPRGRSPHAAA